MNSQNSAIKICFVLEEEKCSDIVLINISKSSSIADYLILANATSTTAVKAVAKHLKDYNFEGETVIRAEGLKEGEWAVLDYGNILVHILLEDKRAFYNLEKLWENGGKNIIDWKREKNGN